MFGGNYAPAGYAFCNGTEIYISQNSALYALLGVTFGGNGTSTFGLPDLRGRAALHYGAGTGLSPYAQGQKVGAETVALTTAQMPAHNHSAQADTAGGAATTPAAGAIWSAVPRGHPAPYSSGSANVAMAASGTTGSSSAHNNRSPYLAIAFIISVEGIFPSRS